MLYRGGGPFVNTSFCKQWIEITTGSLSQHGFLDFCNCPLNSMEARNRGKLCLVSNPRQHCPISYNKGKQEIRSGTTQRSCWSVVPLGSRFGFVSEIPFWNLCLFRFDWMRELMCGPCFKLPYASWCSERLQTEICPQNLKREKRKDIFARNWDRLDSGLWFKLAER